jgi:hypothetical protein
VNQTNPLQLFDSETAKSGRLTRRELVQRLLAGAGAGVAWPLVADSHPIYVHLADGTILDEAEKLGVADWKPLFLNAQQEELLAALSEAIVPGSGKAQVDRFVDLLLSVETLKHQQEFVESLAAFEAESQKRFGKRFPSLDASQQNAMLADAAVLPLKKDSSTGDGSQNPGLREHFENLKGWISGAYYSSEAGMRELGWTGEYVFESFPGCEHPGGTASIAFHSNR